MNYLSMGGSQLVLFDYIINLSIFSLLVSTPLVIRSFFNHRPMKHARLWGGVYGGIISIILVMLSFQHQGYSYDIRYAPVILTFAYLGPVSGLMTGTFALLARLSSSGHWTPAIIGWAVIMFGLSVLYLYIKKFTPVKRSMFLFCSYIVIYVITVPVIFHVFRDEPFFHITYLLFVLLGVIVGLLLIEAYRKMHRTISEKKEVEMTLAASESKYRLIAENTSDLIMVMNPDLSISYFSPSHEMVLGYHGVDLEKVELFKFIHPDDVCLFKTSVIKMFENNESHSMEFRLLHQEGYWIEFESRCMPVEGEMKNVEHIVIISRDISERKKSEEILLQSEKLSIVGELAAGVAHEIRNPLTTIKGFVQLYKSGVDSFDFNELLLSELERIESITTGLLSLGKPQAVQPSRLNVWGLIENTLELLAPEALMYDIQFKLKSEAASYFITGEKNQLKQVFLNILKNAMEAMHDGGEIRVSIRNGAKGECIISIQDQGCGIPEELLPRLGEPFYSLKEKGTGLGVMICHKIIKQHNGSITYSSKEKEGTLVEIKLPLDK
ncbi:ATP-binding protein [Neobacillus pocheonensis]|uniref:ATP-binding protein n=1 Tax=Neobacillus pocheonensis TaxID=363869 RepID=UPI003D2A2ABD